jgi:hypothetical protein
MTAWVPPLGTTSRIQFRPRRYLKSSNAIPLGGQTSPFLRSGGGDGAVTGLGATGCRTGASLVFSTGCRGALRVCQGMDR